MCILLSISTISAQTANFPIKIYESKIVLKVAYRDSLQKMGKYEKSILYWQKWLQDSIFEYPMYNLAVNYTFLGDNDSAFYYLNRYLDLSEDDRIVLVDRDLFKLRKDTARWRNIVQKIENAYLQLLDSATNKPLALQLFYLGIADQEYRIYLPILQQINDSLSPKMMQNDRCLYDTLETIIKQHGFPTLSMVGKLASVNAFLLLQHSPKIKNKYYKMVREAYLQNDFDPISYAMLTDRWLMRKKKRQLYGTQCIENNRVFKKYKTSILYKVKDFKNVNQRREKIGMSETVEETVKWMGAVIPEKYYKK